MSRFLGRRNSNDSDCSKIAGLYDLEETIGRGHFAVVKLARHVFTGEKVAVKVIDKTKLDEISKAHLFQEVRCMKLVQHPHVVRLYEVIDTQTKLYLILELGDGGDMYDHIMKFSGGLDESVARRYFKQIVQAISYCHKLHVVHRDLKPENVVFFEKQGIVKLTDFGFSNKFIPGMKLETSCGSLAYSAPEILLGDSYDAPAVDIWSLGVILYMLVCGTPPFQEANDSETLTMIMDCKYDIHDYVSDSCKDLISTLLIRDPNRRSTLEDILNHPWLKVGDVSCASMASMALTPLISRGYLPDEDHQRIIDRMANGAIAPRDDILKALDRDEYNHIAATYYLLAERCLRKQQEQQASQLNVQQLRKNSAPSTKMKLEPLALSPSGSRDDSYSPLRVPPKDNKQMALIFNQTAQAVNALISPPEETDETDGGPHRRCSLITEESEEEDTSDLETKRVHSLENTRVHSAPSDISGRKENSSEDSMSNTSVQLLTTNNIPIRSKPHPSNRSLHQVRSSPQLLNQICEEGESDDDLIPPRPHLLQRKTIASPEVVRKMEARRKRYTAAGSRGTSCSSSDASDNDETENQKKREKLKHRIHRRDSDQSSDTDGPSGPGCGGNGGNGPNPQGGSAHDDPDNDGGGGGGKGSNNENSSSQGGGSNTNNSSGKQQNHLPSNVSSSPVHNQCEDFANGVLKEVARKISNFSSLSSNLSINSLSSSASKGSRYIVDSVSSTPCHGKDRDVQFLNELNKVKSRVNRASFDFSDLRDSLVAEHGREDRISICSADCPQFNPGKLKRRLKNKFKTDINKNGVILESVVPIQELYNDDKTKSKCCSVI